MSDPRGETIHVQLGSGRGLLVTNPIQGTLRGMHYQREPFGERKTVQVLSGAIHDVVVYLETKEAFGVTMLEGDARNIGPGWAHGYLTLAPHTVLFYTIDKPYSPEHSAGLHYASFGYVWPFESVLLSEQDQAWT